MNRELLAGHNLVFRPRPTLVLESQSNNKTATQERTTQHTAFIFDQSNLSAPLYRIIDSPKCGKVLLIFDTKSLNSELCPQTEAAKDTLCMIQPCFTSKGFHFSMATILIYYK